MANNTAYQRATITGARIRKRNFRGLAGCKKGGPPEDPRYPIGWFDDAGKRYVDIFTDPEQYEQHRLAGWKEESYPNSREGSELSTYMKLSFNEDTFQNGEPKPDYMRTKVFLDDGRSLVELTGDYEAIANLDFLPIATVDVDFSRKSGFYEGGVTMENGQPELMPGTKFNRITIDRLVAHINPEAY
jgi:hypothetical protein